LKAMQYCKNHLVDKAYNSQYIAVNSY